MSYGNAVDKWHVTENYSGDLNRKIISNDLRLKKAAFVEAI